MRMWQVENHTPFDAFGGFERDHDATTWWCVWIKAGFSVDPEGNVGWSKANRYPLLHAPDIADGDAGPLLIEDSDICLPKQATDIVLSGATLSPKPGAAAWLATVSVGDWQKSIEVRPERIWHKGRGAMVAEQAQQDIDLSFLNAFGGPATAADVERFPENPVGRGFIAAGGHPDSVALPCLSYPGESRDAPGDSARPASFSPIPRHWPPRYPMAGTYDEEWMKLRSPLPPRDFQPEFLQSTPTDQRYPGHLRGGEPVSMENIRWGGDPKAIAPAFRLPRLAFRTDVRFSGGWHPVEMKIQSLHLRPSEGNFSLVWAAALPIGAAANDVKVQQSEIILTSSDGVSIPPGEVGEFHQHKATA